MYNVVGTLDDEHDDDYDNDSDYNSNDGSTRLAS